MAKQIGRQSSIGIGRELVRGTAVTAEYFVPWMEITDPETKIETITNNTALGIIENSDGHAVVKTFGNIGWKTKLKDSHIGLLLYSLTGAVNSTARIAPNDTVFDHVFTIAENVQHQSITVVYKDVNTDIAYPLAIVTSFKLSVALGSYCMYEVKTLSKQSESATTTVGFTQEHDFLPQNLTFKMADSQSGLDAASSISVRNLELELDQSGMTEDVLGTTNPNDVLNQTWAAKGKVTLVYNSNTFFDLSASGAYKAIRIDLINSSIIGETAHPELKIDLYKCSITNHSKNLTLDGLVEESFDFTGHYSLADSKLIKITLTNTVQSYSS